MQLGAVSLLGVLAVANAAGCTLDRGGALGPQSTASGSGGGAVSSSVASASSSNGAGASGGAPTGSGGMGGQGGAVALDCSSTDLLACYRFENDVLDGSDNHHDLDPQGTVQYMPGVEGQAVRIAGDTMLMAPLTSRWTSPAYAVEMWIRPQALPVDRAALFDNDCCYSVFLYADGTIRCDGGGAQIFGGAVTPNAWTHVACVHDGSSLSVYVGGMLAGSAGAGPLPRVTSSPAVGINLPELNQRFDGDIDSLRVWGIALSGTELCAIAGC